MNVTMKNNKYIGFDLSTQQLKALVINSDLELLHEANVDFDLDLPSYETKNGVLTSSVEGEIFSPVAMWLEAIDLVLERLTEQGLDFSSIVGLSGAGMQHGTVYWSKNADYLLSNLDPGRKLVDQLKTEGPDVRRGAFTHAYSPNWQDSSTQSQCDAFNSVIGEDIVTVTGSKAHHRFSGPQIMKFRENHPDRYAKTERISLVSSFAASVFLGQLAPVDAADAGGTNLFKMKYGDWNEDFFRLADGRTSDTTKLGPIEHDGGASYGTISPYFVKRYSFDPSCKIVAFTGDNPASLLALPLEQNEAIVSLGTSTTFLMSTIVYKPSSEYHLMRHPTRKGAYMFMLCYKNGGLARESIRDTLPTPARQSSDVWNTFNHAVTSTPPLCQDETSHDALLGLYFPLPEIVPPVPAGIWQAKYHPSTSLSTQHPGITTRSQFASDPRTLLESQFLSIRLRAQSQISPNAEPRQPKRIYLVGGGSANPAITTVCGSVLGGKEGVYKLNIGGNACALGAAHKAAWGCERQNGEEFETFIAQRWKEKDFVSKVDDGYREGVWERYGNALEPFKLLEDYVISQAKHSEEGSNDLLITEERDGTVTVGRRHNNTT